MPFNRVFDEEIGQAAAHACLNDGAIQDAKTYYLALTATSANVPDVAPGIYHAFLVGLSPAATVLLAVARASDSLPLPTASTPVRAAMFPGSLVARIRVMPGQKVVSARLIAGTGDLYLVPVVPL